MPIHYKEKEVVKEYVLESFTCNCCKETKTDILNIQEMLYWRTTGGYGSVWGDGNTVELVLCQECSFKLLGKYIDDIS